MYDTENITDAFLDIDRADSVFEFFFVFMRDDGSAVQEEQTFESAMKHILGGAHISDVALARVRAIYNRTVQSRSPLHDSATRLKEQLSRERPLLVMIFSVLLRLAMDEGMMCRRDREHLTEVFQIFMFTRKEIDFIPDELKKNLECFIYANGFHQDSPSTSSLSEHFEALECTPESSSEEVRSSYRRLVKRYHPDRQPHSDSDAAGCRQQFEKVQIAYETITRTKQLS